MELKNTFLTIESGKIDSLEREKEILQNEILEREKKNLRFKS